MTPNKQPSGVRIVFALAQVTFLDIIRDKVLYNSLFFGFLIFSLGLLASQFTAAHPEKMVLDLGLTGVSLSLSALAGLVGSALLSREIERRTIYVILSRPLTRMHFILGKYLGLVSILFLNWIFLSLVYLGLLYAFQQGVSLFSSALGIALCFGLLEALVVGSIALLFSTFTTSSLSVMFCLGIYLIGKNISELQFALGKAEYFLQKILFKSMIVLIPHLERFNLGSQVSYGMPVSASFVGLGILYSLAVIVFCLSLSGFIFKQREL